MLPDQISLAIGMLVTFLVVAGLKDFGRFIGRDLSGWGTVIAGAATVIVVFTINTVLATIVQLDPNAIRVIDLVLQLIVLLLGAMGVNGVKKSVLAAISARGPPAA